MTFDLRLPSLSKTDANLVAGGAAYRAMTSRLRSHAGGPGEWGTIANRGFVISDWHRVLWATYTRAMSPFVRDSSSQIHGDAVMAGFIEGLGAAVSDFSTQHPEIDAMSLVSEAVLDCEWAGSSLPLPLAGEGPQSDYLLYILRALSTVKPMFVGTRSLDRLASAVDGIDPSEVRPLPCPLAFYFQNSITNPLANTGADAGWNSLTAASSVILSRLPRWPSPEALEDAEIGPVTPTIRGVMVMPDENGDANNDFALFLISPYAFLLRGGQQINGAGFPNVICPVGIRLNDDTELGAMAASLVASTNKMFESGRIKPDIVRPITLRVGKVRGPELP